MMQIAQYLNEVYPIEEVPTDLEAKLVFFSALVTNSTFTLKNIHDN